MDVAGPDTSSALLVLVFALLLGIIKKEQKGRKLKVEGTLLGKIGILMDEKGTKMPKTKFSSLLLVLV